MDHLGTDEFTDLALGTGAGPSLRRHDHVDRCLECSRELGRLLEVVRAARDVWTEDLLTAPPDGVWRSIASELRLGAHLRPPAGSGGPTTVPDKRPSRDRAWARRSALILATTALAAATMFGALATARLTAGPPSVAGPVSRLAPLGVPGAAGTVRLVRVSATDGEVEVTVARLPPTDGYYEVWLMNQSHSPLVQLGTLRADGTATLPIPPQIDLGAHPLVDVSVQASNGNPAHSGVSSVRGRLYG
ncbi:anti-sigma factor [Streptomyces sp. H021]|uniref:anti-sigma factor n=1 Tax=Streptomyces sp. H021 TaxID=1519486 RepID=UPI00099BE4AD|nr:anti-sigma factor [Streptomyces sp. H021]